jgi:hypothetical protein
MGKPHRSPLLGYNHNVSHLGRVFHVQTEDSGPAAPRLFTHLFYEGTILASRKTEYEAMLADDKVRAMMQAQHRQVIKDLAAGLLNDRIVTFFRSRGEELVVPPPSGVRGAPEPTAVPAAIAPAAPVAPVVAETAPPSVVVTVAPPSAVPAAPVQAVPAPAARVPNATPRRNTRPIEIQRTRKPTPAPVTVRPPEARRPPFVRDVPAGAKTSSSEGVVVQRNVVVGASGSERPRIRPPVPYIVTGGTHVQRPAAQVDAAARAARAAAAQATPSPAPEAKPRAPSAFGPPAPDDKSLDEVILEYLSEDGD